jgi:hypothetical protein
MWIAGYLWREVESIGAPANMTSPVASNDCGHALLTDTRVSHHYDPAWFSARASWRAFLPAYMGFNK